MQIFNMKLTLKPRLNKSLKYILAAVNLKLESSIFRNRALVVQFWATLFLYTLDLTSLNLTRLNVELIVATVKILYY